MDAEAAVLSELRRLRRRLPEVTGVVLASVDGLLLASDAPTFDPDPVAALAATSIGLSRQFARTTGHGTVHESVVQAAGGLIITYPAGGRALLTMVARYGADPAALQREGRTSAHRLGARYDGDRAGEALAPQSSVDGCAPRATRASAPMSPAGLPTRRPILRPPGHP